ncbi:MAG: ExeM/NucH family extracellular endonuclease [Chloroflexota bacterium]
MSHIRSVFRLAFVALGLLAILAIPQSHVVRAAPPTDLFISEYIEGSSNNKALEIYNGTGTAVNLSTGGYEIFISFNGGTSTATFALTGSVANGDVYVFAASAANATILAQADQTTTSGLWNGDDFIALRKTGAVVVDSLGVLGTDPGTEWGTGLTSTADNTLQRKDTVCAGDTNTTDAFDPATEWNGFAVDIFTGLGSHTANCSSGDAAPTITSTTPVDNATNVAANTNIDITFSETVTITGTIAVSGSSSGLQNLTPSGGPTTFTLDPSDFTAGETVTVTVDDLQVADQDTDDPPDNMVADYVFDFQIAAPVAVCGDPATLISAVQGSGGTSPLVTTSVTVEGIVVGDFQDYTADPPNELSGYFLQEEDADADADPATSEAVFVFDGQNPATNVAVGDKVRLTGTVTEFGDAPDTLTELTSTTNVQVCSTGNALPTATTITLPVTALSDYEKYENMLVTFPQELTVTEVFTLGRFGEVLLSEGGRLPNPTHAAEPGAPAQAVRDANVLRSITLDDGLTNQNPDPVRYPEPGGLSATNTLRGGDTTTGLTGVLHYFDTTEDFRIQPTGTITWDHDNPRPTDAPAVSGTLKIVGSNTLNFFTTVDAGPDICGPLENQDCRGADSATEFTRQRDKLINALVEMNADVYGLVELENDADASPAGDNSDPVLEDIVSGLNAAFGSGTYAFIDTGVIGGDAIKVGLIYKTATATPVGGFSILDSSVDPNFDDSKNRPVLAQTFEDGNGERVTVAVAHLKSKGSDCGGAPDDQPDTSGGNCNGTRTAAAQAIVDWFATDPTGSGDTDFLLVGDLNSYAKEDPIDVLVNAGYVDLAADLIIDPYSYVFDGEWGYLDYAMASPSLYTQVAGVAEWHINADEPIVLDYNTEFKSAGQISGFYSSDPFRVSDHDPIIVGLDLNTPVTPSSGIYVSTTTPGSVGPLSFGSEDILKWDGNAWSVWFDGSAAGLQAKRNKHNINAFSIPDTAGDDVVMSFAQNKAAVPGIPLTVDGMDLVMWDGAAFSLYFDGSDVELTIKTQEKIDGLQVLDGSASPINGGACVAYLLVSTQGPGRVTDYTGASLKFGGEDVLGFCATSLGDVTAGYWHMVLDGSAEGMPRNSTNSLSLSDDGQTLYLTTQKTFNVDSAVGGHSMVYAYDFGTAEFSGPYFIAADHGLNKKIDGLHVDGDLIP